MIIKINSLESTIEIFYEKYIHLHGFIKLEAESDEKKYYIIIQILNEQTILDYIITRQKLKNVVMTEYITAELESELQYVIQGRPIICTETDKKTEKKFFPVSENIEFKHLDEYINFLKRFDFEGIGFSGGEPFLMIEKIIKYIKKIREISEIQGLANLTNLQELILDHNKIKELLKFKLFPHFQPRLLEYLIF